MQLLGILKNSLLLLGLCFFLTSPLLAESEEGGEYEGISDPFGDPGHYEFANDEKADKEFFHLGRFFMLGFDVGLGIYTGGLGRSVDPGMNFGGRLLYFFDKQIAFEAAVHFSRQTFTAATGTTNLVIDMDLMPITAGFRYYFDTKSAPKAVAMANPYLVFGGGAYLRTHTVVRGSSSGINPDTTSSFGFFAGTGIEFPFYRRHLFLGLDVRYHFIFFPDEDSTLNGKLVAGDFGGDFFAPTLTLTYNF